MYICALLVCCLIGVIQWVYGGEPCRLMVKSTPGSIYKAGDVVIGGLFPVHMKAPQPELDFRSEKVNASCYRWLQVMIFAVEEINNSSHLLPNFTLGYLAADTCLAESTTLLAALAMVSGQEVHLGDGSYVENKVLILGLLYYNSAYMSTPIFLTHFCPLVCLKLCNKCWYSSQVSYLASCECLSDKRRYPLFFRTMTSDVAQAQAMAELLRLMGWTWVGLVSADDDFGRSGIQMLVDALRGTEVRCIHSGCMIHLCFSSLCQALFDEVVHRNITDKQWIATDAWVTYGSVSVPRNTLSLAGTIGFAVRKADIPGLGAFLTRVNPGLSDPFLKELWETVFGCSLSAGQKGTSYVTNFIMFRSDMKQPFSFFQIAHYLREVNFTTPLKEWMNFDENGDPPASYDIINWHVTTQGTIEFVTVPVSVCSNPCPPGTRKAVQKGRPVCCFDLECIRCPERFWSNSNNTVCVPRQVDFLSYNDTMGIVLSILSAVGAALTTATYATFLYHRHTPLVKYSSIPGDAESHFREYYIILCFLCALAFIGQPLAWLCMLRHTLFGISFVLCISCLLSPHCGGPGGLSIHTARGEPDVLICGLWLTLAPPQPTERDIVDNWGPKIILECATGSVVGFSFVLGYIGLLACVCLLLAFLARKLPDNFNEAKLITFSMLIFCTVWVAFVPAYISSPGKYAVAVEIFAILASSYGLLFCIFAPKCFVILLRPERNTKKHLMAR
uniref:G-protein coupled receptors family 3 profile domain-containing protein n=1 Tax=Lates calcarifer TaxID=8187 RepID=A0A4W6C8B1_LATCA